MSDWRSRWHRSDSFAFSMVQLCPAGDGSGGATRIAQQTVTFPSRGGLEGVGMAVCIDLWDAHADCGEVHPRDKLSVGERLARASLALAYGRGTAGAGPHRMGCRSKMTAATCGSPLTLRRSWSSGTSTWRGLRPGWAWSRSMGRAQKPAGCRASRLRQMRGCWRAGASCRRRLTPAEPGRLWLWRCRRVLQGCGTRGAAEQRARCCTAGATALLVRMHPWRSAALCVDLAQRSRRSGCRRRPLLGAAPLRRSGARWLRAARCHWWSRPRLRRIHHRRRRDRRRRRGRLCQAHRRRAAPFGVR